MRQRGSFFSEEAPFEANSPDQSSISWGTENGLVVTGLDVVRVRSKLVLWIPEVAISYRTRHWKQRSILGAVPAIARGGQWDRLIATGYGRKLAQDNFGAETITEIQAHALGARRLFPDCNSILDIGGQDTKAITLDNRGRVASSR